MISQVGLSMLHRFLHGSLQVPGHHSLQSCVQLVLLLVPGQDGQVLQLLLDGVLVSAVLLAKQLELSNQCNDSLASQDKKEVD